MDKQNKCGFCKRIIKEKGYNLVDAFLISFAECKQLSSSGSSVENIEEFLLCKRCFEFYIKPLVSQFKKIEKEGISPPKAKAMGIRNARFI